MYWKCPLLTLQRFSSWHWEESMQRVNIWCLLCPWLYSTTKSAFCAFAVHWSTSLGGITRSMCLMRRSLNVGLSSGSGTMLCCWRRYLVLSFTKMENSPATSTKYAQRDNDVIHDCRSSALMLRYKQATKAEKNRFNKHKYIILSDQVVMQLARDVILVRWAEKEQMEDKKQRIRHNATWRFFVRTLHIHFVPSCTQFWIHMGITRNVPKIVGWKG